MPLARPVSGIIGACLTPFTGDDRVDYDALEREVDFIVSDCDAISIGAAEAAEYRMLSPEDRNEVVRRATEFVGKRIPVILGASHPSPCEVIRLTEFAARVDADLVQVLLPLRPWGGQPTIAELMEYFNAIASASPLPVVVYHDPAAGADPPCEAFVRLSDLNNVQYFMEGSCDIARISRLIEQVELSGKGHYFTSMQPLLATLMTGGSGAAMPPPGTRIGAQVVRAFHAGDLERARTWQRFFSLFPGKWAAYGLPPVMKSAMRHLGVNLGDPARPYSPVTPRDHAQIGQFLRQIGLLGGELPGSPGYHEAVAGLDKEDTVLR